MTIIAYPGTCKTVIYIFAHGGQGKMQDSHANLPSEEPKQLLTSSYQRCCINYMRMLLQGTKHHVSAQ